MNDLISRQAAIREYQKVCTGIKCGECQFLIKVNTEKGSHLITDCKLEAFLHDLPSTQPETIRCKDCKWYGRVDKRRFYRGMDCLQKRIDTIIPDEDFCSRAERKEDE